MFVSSSGYWDQNFLLALYWYTEIILPQSGGSSRSIVCFYPSENPSYHLRWSLLHCWLALDLPKLYRWFHRTDSISVCSQAQVLWQIRSPSTTWPDAHSTPLQRSQDSTSLWPLSVSAHIFPECSFRFSSSYSWRPSSIELSCCPKSPGLPAHTWNSSPSWTDVMLFSSPPARENHNILASGRRCMFRPYWIYLGLHCSSHIEMDSGLFPLEYRCN